MSHARAKRILMKWERYHTRHPLSGAHTLSMGRERMHNGHLNAYSRVVYTGRYAPIGIRLPWTLRVGA